VITLADGLTGHDLAIYSIVHRAPGIHFRSLGRAAHIHSMGQLRHHVDRLCSGGVLVERTDGGYSRYLVQGDHDAATRVLLVRLARTVPRRIAHLLLSGGMTRTALRRGLGCADSTIGYHLHHMVDAGDVVRGGVGRRCSYELANEDAVRKALALMDGRAASERPHGG